MKPITVLAFLVVALLGCSATPEPARETLPVVRGSASYRERVVLPPNAVLLVRLADVTDPEVAPIGLGEQIVPNPGQVPIAFEVPFNEVVINDDRDYIVEARISVNGRVMFATTEPTRVLTQGYARDVDLTLEAVR